MANFDSSSLPTPRVRTFAMRFATAPLGWAPIALFALAYLLGAELGRRLSFPAMGFSIFWPPAAIYLAALVIRPRRDWLVLALAGVLPATLVFYALREQSLVLAAAVFLANTASALFGAELLLRSGRLTDLFRSARTCVRTFGLLLATTVPGALVGSAALTAFGHPSSFGRAAAVWWASGTLGLFVLVPPIVVAREEREPLTRSQLIEAGLACASLLAVATLIFWREPGLRTLERFPYWVLPFLVWIAIRFGRRGTGLAAFLLAVVATYGTTRGWGPFAVVARESSRALVLQSYLIIFTTAAVAMAASVRSRESTAVALESERARLQAALAEIRTLRGMIPICSRCRKLQSDTGTWQVLEKYLSEHTDAQLSHGLCPDCSQELFPELDHDASA
ncbi:MAG TPA: MASE1 domain-containing protein [Thermoanaerobaculia bacterium]|jgi:integral membrane sensor domain MASE1